jgi:solute carrier family 35, member F5
MAITLSSDYLYVLSMLKTTPLVVTVGLSLTIPLAVVGDFFLGKQVRGQVVLGAALVVVSFVAVGIADSRVERKDPLYGRIEAHATEIISAEGSGVQNERS